MPTPASFLTTAEVAARCRISQKTVARWADEGKLRIAGLAGATRLFDPADVDALALSLAADAEQLAADLKAAAS